MHIAPRWKVNVNKVSFVSVHLCSSQQHRLGMLEDIDGLLQACSNSSANALGLLQSYTKPSIYTPGSRFVVFCCGLSLVSITWWRHQMETFSALLAIYAGDSPVPGEFPTQRPVTRSFDVYFDLHPNRWLSKQSWGWWFETLSCSLWRHRNYTYSSVDVTDIGTIIRSFESERNNHETYGYTYSMYIQETFIWQNKTLKIHIHILWDIVYNASPRYVRRLNYNTW